MLNLLHSFDIIVFNFIQDHFRNAPLDQLMYFFTRLGDYGVLWILLAIGLLLFPRTRSLGLLTLITLMMTAALGEGVLKHLFQRPRPPLPESTAILLKHVPSTFSFPSGHTASSFGAATTLTCFRTTGFSRKSTAALFYFFATTIAFSRLYLGLHYFTDIVGGVALGILCSLWVIQKSKAVLE